MNVILVTIDCWRHDYFNRGVTPNIYDFAKNGLVLTQAISTAPCTPLSFLGIFNGSYPSECERVTDEIHPKIFKMSKPQTLAEYYRGLGYETQGFHSNTLLHIERNYGYSRGFRQYVNLESEDLPYASAEDTTDIALQWLMKQEENYFLWVHYMDAHPPFKGEFGEFVRKSANYEYPKISESELDRMLELYSEELRTVDSEVKSLFDYADLMVITSETN